MKEHPIMSSTDSVEAILEGRKTQTRRVIKPQPRPNSKIFVRALTLSRTWQEYDGYYEDAPPRLFDCPYGQVGDRLWVRESIVRHNDMWYYKAGWTSTGKSWVECIPSQRHLDKLGWQYTSRMMPKIFFRITLEITEVRVERLQEITEEDAKAEGAESYYTLPGGRTVARYHFSVIWDSIFAKRGYGWEVNPWVWVISFVKEDKTNV